jgi:hypothetical protein
VISTEHTKGAVSTCSSTRGFCPLSRLASLRSIVCTGTMVSDRALSAVTFTFKRVIAYCTSDRGLDL